MIPLDAINFEIAPDPDAVPNVLDDGLSARVVQPLLPPIGTARSTTDTRILPLAAFAWGVESVQLRPRVRADHVLLVVTKGRVRFELPRRSVHVGAGSIVHAPSGTAFAVQISPDCAGVAVLVPGRMAHQWPTTVYADRVSPDGMDAVMVDIQALSVQSDPRTIAPRLDLIGLTLAGLAPPMSAPSTQAAPSRMADARAIVAAFERAAVPQAAAGRTLCEIAQSVGTDGTGLDRACLAQRGCSALALLHQWQVSAAIELLRTSPRPLKEVAASTGFNGLPHMMRCFIAATGRPPADFRRAG
ncbi:MAG: hypothetical protein DI498_08000 [Paracoccus denitrificans]|nr:MAG: hypothetical protein DI498_08000 [Paracoccus denitrificans]PZO84460.1 MAG: hypothetical protein DI633_08000 [Paracoccus denitrificans]